ncbi:hypothetical protein [Mycolicibacterium sp.]|uniref:hypothetical protein n=1 Tax=Mycolicibacterium sp. TaxID=2320850 RepID=UPI001A357FAF|nr:hypothetical protein [Mycolicibacterium sp.]MBJ7337570.1 hypothetical protein [Mycolicibacterium sp.]
MTLTTSSRGTMADFDITPGGPLRVGIDLGDDVWLDSPGAIVRVRAVDLRDLSQQAATIRAEQPGVAVLADIDVMIAHDAHAAREAMDAVSGEGNAGTLLYVGTSVGLAGLIADIHALGLADGAVLKPLAIGTVLPLIHDELLPALYTMGAMSAAREPRPA